VLPAVCVSSAGPLPAVSRPSSGADIARGRRASVCTVLALTWSHTALFFAEPAAMSAEHRIFNALVAVVTFGALGLGWTRFAAGKKAKPAAQSESKSGKSKGKSKGKKAAAKRTEAPGPATSSGAKEKQRVVQASTQQPRGAAPASQAVGSGVSAPHGVPAAAVTAVKAAPAQVAAPAANRSMHPGAHPQASIAAVPAPSSPQRVQAVKKAVVSSVSSCDDDEEEDVKGGGGGGHTKALPPGVVLAVQQPGVLVADATAGDWEVRAVRSTTLRVARACEPAGGGKLMLFTCACRAGDPRLLADVCFTPAAFAEAFRVFFCVRGH
jgi:hypothetical protein